MTTAPSVAPSSPASAFVITHPEWGIYLGMCMGLGFWSKMDPVGQSAACTFESIEQAREFMATWDNGEPAGVSFAPVVPDDGTFATIAACVAAGLEGWVDEYTPVANERPM